MQRAVLLLALAIGCGGESASRSDPPSAGGSAGSAGSAGAPNLGGTSGGSTSLGGTSGAHAASGGSAGVIERNSGDCAADSGCPGGRCVELLPGGFRLCRFDVVPATSCTGSSLDACCDSSECEAGESCLEGPVVPSCGGAPPPNHNLCASDACTPGQTCDGAEPGVCIPSGVDGSKISVCRPRSCSTDRDCTAEPGGVCATIHDPCCEGSFGLHCVYPGEGCRGEHDCPEGSICAVDSDGAARCRPGTPSCPP
jgi:hypothetical protein